MISARTCTRMLCSGGGIIYHNNYGNLFVTKSAEESQYEKCKRLLMLVILVAD